VGAQVVQRPAAAGAGAQGLVSIGQGALAAGGVGPVQPGPLLGYASRHEDTPLLYVSADGREGHFLFPHPPEGQYHHHSHKKFGFVALRCMRFSTGEHSVS
jgi:hypothetical protein